MKKGILKILLLEDLVSDAELEERELKKSGMSYELKVVDNKHDFEQALDLFQPHIILSDHSLPSFNSLEALSIVKEKKIDVPFILVTATVSEEFAVEIMKNGAADYILKDRLQRLPIAITNAVEKWRVQKEKERYLSSIEANEKKFRALIENNADIITLTNTRAEIIYCSASLTKVLDYQPEEFLGKTHQDFVHPDDAQHVAEIRKYANGTPGEAFYYKFRMLHKNGTYRWFEGTITNLLDDPNVEAFVCNFRDVTHIKHAEEQLLKSEARLRTIFENTSIAFALINTELNVLTYNTTALQWAQNEFGAEMREGTYFVDLFPAGRREIAHQLATRALEGHNISHETGYQQKDGSIHWYYVNFYPIKRHEEEIMGVCIAIADITERKNAEQEKEKTTAELIRQNKDLEQFAYIVSHNLRAPVANIIGLTHSLKHAETNEKEREFIMNGIASAAGKLDEIIIDLNHALNFSRANTEKRELVKFESLVSDIKTSISEMIRKTNATIITDFSQCEEMVTQKSYLFSIFFNLVSNSIKYHREGVDPVIQFKTIREKGKILIVIKDNGIGIDMDKYESQVFGLYKRFHNHVEGKGMGLFIVKTQVETIGGRISLQSAVNRGSIFTIEFDM